MDQTVKSAGGESSAGGVRIAHYFDRFTENYDIFLPYDYPQSFVARFYNEQYLLAAYLLGGPDDEVRFPCYYVARHPKESKAFLDLGLRLGLGKSGLGGGAFWARKGTEPRT